MPMQRRFSPGIRCRTGAGVHTEWNRPSLAEGARARVGAGEGGGGTDLTRETCAIIDHADCTAPTRQQELDHTGQGSIYLPSKI